jgi:hypothetical protein
MRHLAADAGTRERGAVRARSVPLALSAPVAIVCRNFGWLASEGIWKPSLVELSYGRDYQDEIETALIEFADNDSYRIGRMGSLPLHELARIYGGKLADQLEQSMIDLELAVFEPRSHNLLAHQDVAAIVLAITAKYVAASTAAALCGVSWAKVPGVVDVILLRDVRM